MQNIYNKKILVLARKGSFQHSEVIKKIFPNETIIDGVWRTQVIDEIRPDLLISFDEHYCELALCILYAKKKNIPTLLIRDGILESRMINFESNQSVKRNIRDYFISDIIVCLGINDKTLIESWNNYGKCVDLGSPRIDKIISKYRQNISQKSQSTFKKRKKLLIISAKSPYFSKDEKIITISSFKDLINILEKDFSWLDIHWRLTKELAAELNIKNNNFEEFSGSSLHQILSQVDLVITTPSTALIEAMLFNLPVGVLDYHKVEVLYKSLWNFSNPKLISTGIKEMVFSTAIDLEIQNKLLNEQLSNIGNSEIILKELIISILYNKSTKFNNEIKFSENNIEDEVIKKKLLEYELIALRGLNRILDEKINVLKKTIYKIPFYKIIKKFFYKQKK
jgi:hypothetical protein